MSAPSPRFRIAVEKPKVASAVERLDMALKLMMSAQTKWRKLSTAKIIEEIEVKDRIKQGENAA